MGPTFISRVSLSDTLSEQEDGLLNENGMRDLLSQNGMQ
jgi:hypothetical protein